MLIHDLVKINAEQNGEKIAIVTESSSISYKELDEKSSMLADWLTDKGIKRGERLLIYMPNSINTILILLAASKIGAIFIIIHSELKNQSLSHIIKDSEPTLIFSDKDLCGKVSSITNREVLVLDDHWKKILQNRSNRTFCKVIPNDIATVIYTSGSTGNSKGVVSSHNNVLFSANAIQKRLQIREDDVIGCFLPLSFDYGLYQFFLAAQVGATLALSELNTNGTTLLKKIVSWNVTCLPIVPSLLDSLLMLLSRSKEKDVLQKLRMITNTGAHLSKKLISDFKEKVPWANVFVMFGLTECKRISIMLPEEYELKPDSVGRPLDDTECFVVDENGNVLRAGERGELVVRGSNVMQGYWRSPELTNQKYRNWGEGFEKVLFTGDMFSIDDEGFLYFYGRRDSLFKQNGFRMSSDEIENAALCVCGIQEAVLIPKKEDKGSVLFVRGNVEVNDVYKLMREKLEDYKLPNEIVFIDEMPHSNNGKIDKNKISMEYKEYINS